MKRHLPRRTRRVREAADQRDAVTRVALFGEFGVGSIGNDASLASALARLRQARPDVEFEVLGRPDATVRDLHGLRLVPYSSPAGGPFGAVGRHGRDALRLLRQVRRYRLIVVTGTGLLEANRASGGPSSTMLGLAALAVAARLRRTPVAWLNVGGATYRTRSARAVAALAAAGASYRSYRDGMTHRQLAACWPPARHDRLGADLVFADRRLDALAAEDPADGELIIVSTIDLPARHGGTSDDDREAQKYRDGLVKLCAILQERGFRVRFVVCDAADLANTTRIESALTPLDADAGPVRLPDRFSELVQSLAPASVVIASRFHLLLAATLAGRAPVALAHADKDVQHMRELGADERIFDAYDFDPDAVAAAVAGLAADPVTSREALAAASERGRVAADAAVQDVLAVLTASERRQSR